MDESNSLTIDETASNNSSENSQHASEMLMGKRPWTSGNFEVIEVFEDEAQLNEWLKNPGGGNNDWIIECNRETRTHRVTELICRRSQKYSSRQKSSVSYSCQARLRIRRPLPDRTEMDQSIIVEKTAIDHDHEPKDNGFERHNGSRDVEHTISMAEEEDGDKVTEADNAERERGDEVDDGNNAEGERDDEIEDGKQSEVADERNSVEIASVEGEQEQKTEFIGKEEEKTDGRKSVEIAADAEGSSIKEEEQGDTEFMSLMEVDKKEPSEEKSEFIQEVDTSILSIPTSTTANMVSNRSESSSQEQIMTSGPTTRPKRNRTRRLFTPSPPPRLGGEPKRKKEMSDDSFSKEPSTTPSMQNVLVGKKIPWAKEQPRQSHSVHSMSTALIPSTSSLHEKRIGLAKPSSSQSNTKFISVSSSSVHNLPPQTTTTLPNINLQAQNDKWTRENLQLKRQNQEQQQQIQALISANRELIWAFNESRREHDELMKQLRLLTNTNDGGHVNGNGSGGGGSSNRARAAITTAGTAASTAHPKAGIAKRISGGAGQTQQRRPQNRGKSSMVFNNMSANSLPPSLAILNKAQKQSASQTYARKPKSRSASGSGKSTNEQLLANVKCEIDEQMEHGSTPPGTATQKLSREEKIAQIKEQLENLPLDLETSKLLGNRRPAFFTPTEFGDWHSVVSGDLRKQLVLQIFQALCPEIGQNIEEYIKIYPSRSDYFRKSVEFAFNAENEVFVAAPSRDDYFRTLADKIFTLRESASRFASGNGRADEREKRNPQQSKRTLADVLKKRSRPPDEEKEEEEEDEPITED